MDFTSIQEMDMKNTETQNKIRSSHKVLSYVWLESIILGSKKRRGDCLTHYANSAVKSLNHSRMIILTTFGHFSGTTVHLIEISFTHPWVFFPYTDIDC